ncbi:hypothetical protein TVAGG3_0019080 [Trichomonas vaginalis G3]|uniref:uncharacterized protein n=1 Tax=Trichomonas vaginalis (strain ATCC PRA-98 / G3) TaxID=412133 RepID=UPI0021E5ACF3|nr:uncharacterized protein TVAGG3_1070530 [Trichomonas vaginalis G3]XP_051097056.1 hypothetical protein TVAGG3_0583160 [Trichomonas vaginalis G3]XP_051105070.1 hypothetical protein TVAGG3_0019000 [Trichomonas vaginalis G3]XP_051105074.1 hypothetical protein TVAGG3_0019080 [Trichomonas vaginalis G3]KAI5483135.1 hypothetical protein TVAGG3_1070530 [Trichomonas vaginalis G3]KAI5522715.1 hypothetical protein TVAGG3_0583160 [Trichomonas vaginalis G3]KAI5539560.1 hypothetical protein TVAGG3_0019000
MNNAALRQISSRWICRLPAVTPRVCQVLPIPQEVLDRLKKPKQPVENKPN